MEEVWTFKVQSVSRVSPEFPDEIDGPFYAVTFEANGPDASAEVEVFVPEPVDEAEILREAMSKMHEAFASWARATAGRHIANDPGAPG